jgi:hypothetical protein
LQFLDATYEDPDPQSTARAEMKKLQQGNKEFTVHYSAFQRLMAVLQWPNDVKRQTLYETLSTEIKDALQYVAEPDDFDQWIASLQKLDQKLRARANERKGKTVTPAAPARNTSTPASTPGYSKNPKDSWANKNFTGAAPMDLSAQQRAQRRQEYYSKRMQAGVCTRCGDPNHMRAQCPHKSMVLNALLPSEEEVPAAPAEESGKE